MIHKLRRKFILVAMLSMFAVLAVIVGALNVANYCSMTSSADNLLEIIVENGGTFPEFFMGRRVEFGEKNRPEFEDMPDFDERPKREEFPDFDKNPDPGEASRPGKEGKKDDEKWEDRSFSNETPYMTRFFSVEYSPFEEEQYTAYTGQIASVSEQDAVIYAKTVITRFQRYAKMKGFYGNYRYVVKPDENGGRLVVFLDVSKEKQSFVSVLFYSLILSGIGLLAVFILVWFFSKKVFKPVEESDRKQKQFITDASHELKTPLTIISANVEILEMESEESEWSKSIKHQVERMTSLVEQMVTLSRLDENNELEMTDFSLSDAVEDTADTYRTVAERNNQKMILDVKEGITMHGDETKIRQMVGLLVENATKYATPCEGEECGVIKVTLLNRGKKNKLTVWNTLSSTETGNKDRLFERFYRPDESRNSKKGGSGIGLSIVKSIAEAHKGKVHAVSEDTHSIQFEVII